MRHWRGKKELVGVSVRTILTNVFVQLIIMLYLLDNNENTSWMILLYASTIMVLILPLLIAATMRRGQGVGLLIEAWKITKAVDIKLVQVPGRLLPKLDIKDRHVLSEDEKKTQEYDKLAFKSARLSCRGVVHRLLTRIGYHRYVTWATVPCLAGYTIYSLMYNTHRGWYSFILSTRAPHPTLACLDESLTSPASQ